MNKSKALWTCLALLGAVSLAAASSPAAGFAGIWIGKIETGMGVDELTLTLVKAGTSYTGIINDSLGLVDKDTPIININVDGTAIGFSFKAMGGSMEFGMKLTLAADKLTGELRNEAEDGGAPFEFERKK